MDCNKTAALNEKELAEKKFEQKDVMEARKHAMKAHNLFPDLDGLQPLLETLNIYLSAERKLNGDIDWYGVLGVDPSSDDETVRKQYRKLALTLHPDKNKAVGAEGAFKILSEAWSLLSDKTRRAAYDQKRTPRGTYEKVVPHRPSNPVKRNGLHPSANNGSHNLGQNRPNPHLSSVRPPRKDTFWTVCTSCRMHFEYMLCYLNKRLECFSCKQPFSAEPIAPPQTTGNTVFSAGRAANGIQQPQQNFKRRRDDAQVSATLEEIIKSRTDAFQRATAGEANGQRYAGKVEKPRKRRRANEQKININGIGRTDQLAGGSQTAGHGSINGFPGGVNGTEKVNIRDTRWSDSRRELSLFETRNMLMAKAKTEIYKKLNEWKITEAEKPKTLSKGTGHKGKENMKEKAHTFKKFPDTGTKKVATAKTKSNSDAVVKDTVEIFKASSPDSSLPGSENKPSDAASLSMAVPDPDFHDFDNDRTEKSFGDQQVWAAYDDDDGMPRYYAIVQTVLSRNPFKMRISWLNSKSNAEFSSVINWVGSGFYKTNGDFRVGRYEVNNSVNSFSHQVKWSKGARGAIRIYPSKGDVWALYRNWSPEWSEHTGDEVIHKYDMVEVLDDYNEEKGVTVVPLVKIAGFKTVFRRNIDQKQVRVIPREEMFRFSHQVPSCVLTGQESPDVAKGWLELDPAATPIELLKVITEAKEQVKKENPEKATEHNVSDDNRTGVEDKILSGSGNTKLS